MTFVKSNLLALEHGYLLVLEHGYPLVLEHGYLLAVEHGHLEGGGRVGTKCYC